MGWSVFVRSTTHRLKNRPSCFTEHGRSNRCQPYFSVGFAVPIGIGVVIAIRQACSRRWQLWLAVLCTGLITQGCARGPRASMGQLLDNVPSRKSAATATDEKPVSSVTANAPGQAGQFHSDDPKPIVSERESQETLVAEIDEGPFSGASSRRQTTEPVLEIPVEPEKAPSGPKIWDRRLVSAAAENTVNRLKKALSTDARRETPAIDPLSRTHPLRVRIDGLQQKAAELLEAGDLQEARVQAERAVELSASLALEFLPNEEHPEDLLQRITTAIDALDQPPSANPRLGTLDDEPFSESQSLPPVVGPLLPLTDGESSNSRLLNLGSVAANRPLRLAARADAEPTSETPAELVAMVPIFEGESRGGSARGSIIDGGMAAPTSADRLRLRGDAGPLLVPAERRPSTSQVAEVAPLPAFRATVAPRPASSDPEKPGTGFEWSDLWPLGVLCVLMLCFVSGLLVRRIVAGH